MLLIRSYGNWDKRTLTSDLMRTVMPKSVVMPVVIHVVWYTVTVSVLQSECNMVTGLVNVLIVI